ncbi:PI-PLC X domain-containing protein 3 [Halotydeus destructor]|nr:PI-PLC X domain-containing protein 3 [Halotydeus destructor]
MVGLLLDLVGVLFFNFVVPFESVDCLIGADLSPRVWLTVSSLADRSNDATGRLINERKLEINWKNVPVDGQTWLGVFTSDPLGRQVAPDEALVTLDPVELVRGRYRTEVQFPTHTFSPGNMTSSCLGHWVALVVKGDSGDQTVMVSNCIRAQPTWMADNFDHIKDKSLKDIFIPGSHNAGSYEFGNRPHAKSLLRKYVICHDESVFNQLVYGIRYLDIRVSYESVKGSANKVWIVHGILRTEVTLDDVMRQVKQFMDATEKEVVILDFHRFEKGFDDFPRDALTNEMTIQRHREVLDILKRHLADHMSEDLFGYNVRLGSLVTTNRRLVVGYAANRYVREAKLYPRVRHLWAEAENVTSLEKYFERVSCLTSGYEATSAMAQLTPTTWGVIFDKYGGLRKMAQQVNWLVSQWFAEKWWRCANIVSTDFFLGNNIIDIAIESNRLRLPQITVINRRA